MLGLIRRVVALFDPSTRRRFVLALLGSVVVALAEVAAVVAVLPLMELLTSADGQPSGTLRVLSDAFGDPERARLAAYVAALVFAGFLLKGVLSLVIRWWTLGFLLNQGIRTSADLMRSYLGAPFSMHLRRSPAELLRTMNDAVSQVYTQVVVGSVSAATEAITVVALTLTLLVISPLPTLLVGAYFTIAVVVLQRVVKRRAVRAGEDLIHASFVTTQAGLHALGGIKEIKLRQEQELFVGRYVEARALAARALRVTSFLTEVPKYTMEILFILGIGLTTVLVYATDSSLRSLGTIALFAVAGFRMLPSLVRMMASMNLMRSGSQSLTLVEEDLAAARRQGEVTGPVPRLAWGRDVALDAISFRYTSDAPDVLREVSLRIPAGSSLALVGASGAGKSTLVDVLLGLLEPTAGRMLVDGHDVRDRVSAWQAGLAMVPQDVFLLDETLRENIRFSPEAVDPGDARLARVIDQARLRDLVDGLPEGLATTVGDRGSRLSGGQRQRVGIARALFREPSLLVLDEATSALDNETERHVTDAVDALHGQVTLVVVAHRLSTVRHCDQIAFLRDGTVAAIGTFEELRATSADFARLVALGELVGPAAAD